MTEVNTTITKYIDTGETDDPSVVRAGIVNTSPTVAGGYATGAGGAVTQITSRSTGVEINKACGTITTDTTSLAAEGTADFIVTNSVCAAVTDIPVVAIQSGSDGGGTTVSVAIVTAGTFTIRVHNGNVAAGTAETGAIIINFQIHKSVAA